MPEEAEKFYEEAVELHESRERDKAMKKLDKALELDPGNPKYLAVKTEILNMRGKYEETVKQLEEAPEEVQKDPTCILKKNFALNQLKKEKGENEEESWFEPRKVYEKKKGTGSFRELLGVTLSPEARKEEISKLREFEGRIAERLEEDDSKILEIGPGRTPSVENIKERMGKDIDEDQVVYMDVKQKFLEDKENTRIQGKLGERSLPFDDKSFGPAILNEVLTHVEPEERKDAVKELARVADEIMITDRVREEDDPEKVNPEKMEEVLDGENFDTELVSPEVKGPGPRYFFLHAKEGAGDQNERELGEEEI